MRSDKRYDAVVVGSGLGGLAAAARLARAGAKVRLLERHNQPGGYATTFYRHPYEFEVSLHELSGIGTPEAPGALYELLAELGITDRVSFLPIRQLYRGLAPGLDVRVPAGRAEALAALGAAFPHEARGLARLFDLLYRIKAEAEEMTSHATGKPSVVGTLVRYPTLAHAATAPLGPVLERELRDPLARLAFAQLWGYFGLPPSRLSLLYFAIGLTAYLNGGASYPVGKSQALSNAFVAVIEEAGGEVRLGDGAQRILVEGAAVRGVITEQGEHLAADHVVVNANPITAAVELIGVDALPEAFVRRLSVAEPSLSSFCVHLGIAASVERLGIEDHQIFFSRSVDMDQQYRSALGLEAPDAFVMTTYNVSYPEFSPAGTSVITLVALADGAAWRDVSADRYGPLKQRIAESMVERVAAMFPAVRQNIEVLVTATPVTNMRYTGNVDGAIYGFANTPAQNPAFRLAPRGPLDGLWFAGAWTQPGGSYQTTITCGAGVADEILAAQRRRAPRALAL